MKQENSTLQSKAEKKEKIKFEHILQIYWTKGLFFGGKLFYTNKTFYETFQLTPGLGQSFKNSILDKLELKNSVNVNTTSVSNFKKTYHKELVGFLNHYYSQVSSVNNNLSDLSRLNIIRLYLIKCYRGRCHALGKPVNGQRTWSNAWSAYKNNLVLRRFISETKNSLSKLSTPEKINYKLIKKKYVTKQKKIKKIEKKKTIWI